MDGLRSKNEWRCCEWRRGAAAMALILLVAGCGSQARSASRHDGTAKETRSYPTEVVGNPDVRCQRGAKHKASLGSPIATDGRGSDAEALFIDLRDNYVRDCVYAPHGMDSITSGPLTAYAKPGPSAIGYNNQGLLCGRRSTGGSIGEAFGRVGTNVTAATFHFAHAASVPGTLWHGFYEVWWTWAEYPDEVTLTTKSGSKASFDVSTHSKSC